VLQIRAGCIIFTWLKPYFIVCALIFYVCEGLSQPIANQLNMQKYYGINIFDYEGHYLLHTRNFFLKFIFWHLWLIGRQSMLPCIYGRLADIFK